MSSSKQKSVTYSSTRGCATQKHLSFRDVVMRGLAHDRGLFVPDTFPQVTAEELESWRSLKYKELAVEVIRKYVKDDQVPYDKLKDIVHRSCDAFRSSDVTPLVEVNGHSILELFHGPTFAFKDVALQMLGNFFEYFLEIGSNGGRLAVLGATSGDTGSAAIYGLRGKKGVDCVILFPNGRVSEIQERQMTTVSDSNIHCVAIDGTFDDCQDLVKGAFRDVDFREQVQLGAVNSINWCRVLAQTTYYFWSWLRVSDKMGKDCKCSFSVPTGNFGDILAGFYSKQMGLPVDQLLVATNENDILERFFTKGEYHRYDIQKTISPSMDICVSSNFERYLYFLSGNDPVVLASWMEAFENTGKLTIVGKKLDQAREDFCAARADTKATLATIKEYFDDHNYMLCPHSAVGVNAIHQSSNNIQVAPTTVCLATAHFAKFPDACQMAVPKLPESPTQLTNLFNLPTRKSHCKNNLKEVQQFMISRIDERMAAEQESNKKKCILSSETLIKRSLVVGAIVVAASCLVQLMSKQHQQQRKR